MRVLRLFTVAVALAVPALAMAQQITVSTAASLTDAFKELGPKFEASKPGTTVRFNFGASGALLQQISQGAPADVFVSADQETMNRAVVQNLIDIDSRRNFVSNSLVMIEPAKGGAGLKSLQDLTGASVRKIAIGKTATVPAGRYTKEALDNAKLWTALEPKFVQADNVRQVLDYVSRGETEAGFVYRTDAAIMASKVKVVLTATGHSPIAYPIAVVSESRQKAIARDFIAFLYTDAAQQVLARYGFGKP
ncbi:MAG: molybdate ABC transporter substrate-binding protein [Ramlibacter sp.]|nr:molybdate ABC transporter substrate-binding protein [Ramlibacter sp.]